MRNSIGGRLKWAMAAAILAGATAVLAGGQKNHDGCAKKAEWCVCGNTKEAGRCGPGPDKGGLYCHCDPPVVHHDQCGSVAQACKCGNTGEGGKCKLGPMKQGLYCQCG